MRSNNWNSIIDWLIYWIINEFLRTGAPAAEALQEVSKNWDKSENDGILPQIQEEIDMDEDELHFLEDEN